ncbi:murein L,D-transpeptidase [Alteromonas sp. KUL106]|uniref:L,D-transpeptidase family protein n=1 Tax=Alteromonas sp. KUL106 TaxID=2480799 RepID=UPI0012E567D0|nr:L,D-transpeptidase family protein [Alteromonas sp. KUL106]GFD68247.1 murein L,D-transpeptidase [Alteromonas sp. KUL106]
MFTHCSKIKKADDILYPMGLWTVYNRETVHVSLPFLFGVLKGLFIVLVENRAAKLYWIGLIMMLFFSHLASASQQPNLRQRVENLLLESVEIYGSQNSTPSRVQNKVLVSEVYAQNGYQLIWFGTNDTENRLRELLHEIRQSELHGFSPEYYHASILESRDANTALLDVLATDAFISQTLHRLNGLVSPANADEQWFLKQREAAPVASLNQALANGISSTLEAMWPTHHEYQLLLDKKRSLLSAVSTVTTQIPAGPTLKLNSTSERVILLKSRLFGPGTYSELFDRDLLDAVKQFQMSAGLEPDGIVGSSTLEALNATTFSWLEKIDANLERWRWLPHQSWSTYLRVNIASFQLRGFSEGEETLDMPVIVGTPVRQTPVFTESMKYMVFNPYWTVPFSIATKDKLIKLKADPSVLAQQGYEAQPAGVDGFSPVDVFDWKNVTRGTFHYTLRQKPGPHNALGKVKFMLPNKHAIYLHDTPDHSLFSKSERNFSSGCIRVSNPLKLSHWVLTHSGQPEAIAQAEHLFQSEETTTLYLKKPIPVLIVYFTAFADERGSIVFRRDAYNRDGHIIAKLKEFNRA